MKGRPSKKGKEIEEPKKPKSVLKEEMENEILLKMGYDPATTTFAQKSDAMYKAVMMVEKQSKPVSFTERLKILKERDEKEKQEKLEYGQKMREYRIAVSLFKCTLNKAQMELLRTFFNEHLLEEPICLEELEDIFMGKDKGVTYRLKNWDLFILLFKGLSGDGFDNTDDYSITYLTKCFKSIEGHQYISEYWQKSVGESKIFADKKGNLLDDGKIRRRLSKIKNVLKEVHIPVDSLERLFEQLVKLEV